MSKLIELTLESLAALKVELDQANAYAAACSAQAAEESARREQAEDELDQARALPDLWEAQAAEYPDNPLGCGAAAAVRLCAKALRATLSRAPQPAESRAEQYGAPLSSGDVLHAAQPEEPGPWEKLQCETYHKFRAASERAESAQTKLAAVRAELERVDTEHGHRTEDSSLVLSELADKLLALLRAGGEQ